MLAVRHRDGPDLAEAKPGHCADIDRPTNPGRSCLRMDLMAIHHGLVGEKRRGESSVSSEPTIQTNVDVFSDNGAYFVRTEIEARIVNVHGPVKDLESAKREQEKQVARLKASTEALRRELQRATD